MEQEKRQIQIEIPPEQMTGHYANLAIISHNGGEFFIDMICLAPNAPKARVQSRIVMNPENAKQLLFALKENVARYEQKFGTITPKGQPGNGGGNAPGGILNWPGNNQAN